MEESTVPDDYIIPGNESILYVNAYSVTRHYGGSEEGGWYYNQYEPLASIPIKAISHEGHDDICHNCSCARKNIEGYSYCEYSFELKPKFENQVNEFTEHLKYCFEDLKEGNIYSVLGGVDIQIVVESNPAHFHPTERPRYE